MKSILLIEPSSSIKCRGCAQALREPVQATAESRDEIVSRLRCLRASAVETMEVSLERLVSAWKNRSSQQYFFADDAGDAVSIISRICKDTKTVGINKSAVVTGELAPFLNSAGFRVLEPYYDELSEMEARFTESWQLPAIPFAARLNAFGHEDDLQSRRQICVQQQGARDIVAVIGVNALSAEDGSAVLLQHRQNISRLLTECREIILIAGIDKIVSSTDDAVFQSRSMGWFGADTLALGLGQKKDNRHNVLDRYPFTIPPAQASEKVSFILLDNGRRRIAKSEFRQLLQCIGCRACIAACPGSRFFDPATPLSPREILFQNLLNVRKSLNHCLQCKTCRTCCPLNIDLPGMILRVRNSRNNRLFPALSDLVLSHAEEVERMASFLAPVVNILLKNRLIKQLSQFAGGVSSRRDLPSFATKTFEEIYRDFKSGKGQ